MEFLNGTFKLLYVKIGGFFKPIGCLTDNSFNESVRMLSTTTRQNPNGWETSVPTTQRYSIPFSGLQVTGDDLSAIVTFNELRTLKRGRTRIEWKTENLNGGNAETGFGYITSLSESSGIDEFQEFSGDIEGWSEPITEEGNIVFLSDVFEAGVFE